MKLTGPWRRVDDMLDGYANRLKFARTRVGEKIAEAFLEKVKELAPHDKRYDVYLKSLKVVQLMGKDQMVAFAVISENLSMSLGSMLDGKDKDRTVVYFNNPVGVGDPVVELLSAVNPWPVDMVPDGIPNDVRMVHRIVTEGEARWARRQVKNFVSKNISEFKRYGMDSSVKKDSDTAMLNSLPDYMSLALRAEFGIGEDPHPHWRPAVRWVQKNIWRIVKDDPKIKDALTSWLFHGHRRSRMSFVDPMPLKDFEGMAETFQDKVVPNG